MGNYLDVDAVNWSSLKHLQVSPKRYRWHQDNPQVDSDFMRLGRATHAAVFEPDRFLSDFVAWTGKKRGGKAWKTFQDEHAHQTILTLSAMERATAIGEAVRTHPEVRILLESPSNEYEREIVWTDLATQLKCKAKLDCVIPFRKMFLDLKTDSKGINLFSFSRTMNRMGYAHQMRWYQRGLREVTGEDYSPILVPVESFPPFDAAVYDLGQESIEVADAEIDELLATLVNCIESGQWPGAHPVRQTIDLPRWRLDTETEDAEGLGLDWSAANDGDASNDEACGL